MPVRSEEAKARRREYNRAYQEANREKIRERKREYQRRFMREYRAKHPEFVEQEKSRSLARHWAKYTTPEYRKLAREREQISRDRRVLRTFFVEGEAF